MTTPTNLAAADLLDRAAGRVARGWTQNVYAQNRYGQQVLVRSRDAACWCATGAVIADFASRKVVRTALDALEVALPRVFNDRIILWNDHPDRTQDEVVDHMRETAKRLRGDA